MILSHKYKFIFIKTTKTAGTSLEVALSRYCGKDDIITPILPPVELHEPRNDSGFYNHIGASEIKSKVHPDVWKNYFKFTFERNPYDKMVSWYWWIKHQHHINENFKEFCLKCEDGIYDLPTDFEKYSIDEKIVVDFIGKYESLSVDFENVCKDLNIPFDGNITKEKAYSRQNNNHHSIYYDNETKKIIEKHFWRELKLFY